MSDLSVIKCPWKKVVLLLQKEVTKLREERDTDSLTGLPNRRGFERNLTRLCERRKQADRRAE